MRPLWSKSIGAPVRGLAFSRERGELLLWDAAQQLHVYHRQGACRLRRPAPGPISCGAAADDGSGFALGGTEPRLWRLNRDLQTLWERQLAGPIAAVALDSFGELLAASDTLGQLHLFDGEGKLVAQAENPRPLRYLLFLSERPRLLGAANLGLVICYNHEGNSLWRDGLAANVGDFTTSGDGATILAATFSRDLAVYSVDGPPHRSWRQAYPCRLAAVSYDGQRLLAADLGKRLFVADADGQVRAETELPSPAVALALAPLADFAAAAGADGTLLAWELSR